MIEFWPDCCGYKLQVDDSEAGKWIRCPYCNARIQVPASSAKDDVLADAIASLPDELATPETQVQISGPAFGKRGGGIDPLRWAVTAALIVVFVFVIAVVTRWGIQQYSEWASKKPTPQATPVEPQAPQPGAEAPQPENVLGSLPGGQSGLYVDSYPEQLRVYVHAIEQPYDEKPELLSIDTLESKGVTPLAIPLPPGDYWVFVTTRLNTSDLMLLPGYGNVRRSLEDTGDLKAAADYFIVDGAARLEYRSSSGRFGTLVKIYRVVVDSGTWTSVTSYFLPKADPQAFAEMLPAQERYAVDETIAKQEMDYRGVPAEEQLALLTALRRRGKAIWEESNGLWRVFQMTPQGLFSPAYEQVGEGQWAPPGRHP